MDGLIAYIIILVILTLIYVRTTKISSKENEYLVISRSENTAGLALSFYASGMGLWILTAPAEVAWWGLGLSLIHI